MKCWNRGVEKEKVKKAWTAFLFYLEYFISSVRGRPRLSGMTCISLAGTAGLEPVTYCVTGSRSNQLSYAPKRKFLISNF